VRREEVPWDVEKAVIAWDYEIIDPVLVVSLSLSEEPAGV
jgi:hypothetical protein